jgi:hypothetical protein
MNWWCDHNWPPMPHFSWTDIIGAEGLLPFFLVIPWKTPHQLVASLQIKVMPSYKMLWFGLNPPLVRYINHKHRIQLVIFTNLAGAPWRLLDCSGWKSSNISRSGGFRPQNIITGLSFFRLLFIFFIFLDNFLHRFSENAKWFISTMTGLQQLVMSCKNSFHPCGRWAWDDVPWFIWLKGDRSVRGIS